MPTPQKMAAEHATIVSPMDWDRRCGESMGHDAQDCTRVAQMLTDGTKHPRLQDDLPDSNAYYLVDS